MRKSLIFLLFLCTIVSLPLPYLIPGIGQADFIAYWSSARLLITDKDPYNISDISELQISHFPERKTAEGNYLIVAWNPPWLNLLLLPLSLVEFKTAAHIWLFINAFLMGMSVLLAWDLSNKPFDRKGYVVILSISLLFIQVLISLIIGQITSIVLFSIVLSYWLINKNYDYLAGFVLAFATIKPHLIYFPLLLLLIWSIYSRRYKILLGFLSLLFFSSIVMWLIIPDWISKYIHLLSNLPDYRYTANTLGNFFEAISGVKIFNYSFLLVLLLIIPFLKILQNSPDITPINSAILISLLFAPYGFGVDHILAIPSFVQIYSWIRKKQFSMSTNIIYIVCYISINTLTIIFLLLRLPTYLGFFFPLIYLILYLTGLNLSRKNSPNIILKSR